MQTTTERGAATTPLMALTLLLCLLCLVMLNACSRNQSVGEGERSHDLTMMPTFDDSVGLNFVSKMLDEYGRRTGVKVSNIDAHDSMDTRLSLYQRLFAMKSPLPDICELDNIWPGLLADDLIDLKPYLGNDLATIDKSLLDAFTVKGRLIGVPVIMDTASLYYRVDLLSKYGYGRPPETWDELGRMARVIQDGERRGGNQNFWGYVWQGAAGEALTCNALEWERAEGAPAFDGSRTACVLNEAAERAWNRAQSWVGTISPPGVVEYDEEDSTNLWLAGSAAFARGWSSMYGSSRDSKLLATRFGAAALPAGSAGRAWTFGGMALGVSRYSRHPAEAAAVVRYFASSAVQRRSLIATSDLPTRTSLLTDASLLSNTSFGGWLGSHWREGIFTRPSTALGKSYPAFSQAYSAAVHDAISGKQTPHDAMVHLQAQLLAIAH